MDKTIRSYILKDILQKTKNAKEIPIVNKNGIPVHKMTIFEDICLRNKDNLDTIALEINGNQMTYYEFFWEVERYIRSFNAIGIKEHDVVTVCLPVSVEFICCYFALTTIGAVCNAANIMLMAYDGIKTYTEERCSKVLVTDIQYYQMLMEHNAFNDENIEHIILTSFDLYGSPNKNKVLIPKAIVNTKDNIIPMNLFLEKGENNTPIAAVPYDENRIATFTYTSGTTGKAKCIAHSDLAALFLVCSHDFVNREDELVGDRTLLTIPLQHPTGLFYAMVLQAAGGKTLVLEPRYDKTLFFSDLRDLKINHAVQTKSFYAQLVQEQKNGNLHKDDLKLFKHPYSGGEGIPYSLCQKINATLKFAGCKNELFVGYGRSEEGSATVAAYNISNRANTVGQPIPGVKVRLVNPITQEELEPVVGCKGEIQVSTPTMPMNNCYMDKYNKFGKSDDSVTDTQGTVWTRPNDIATIVNCNGKMSYLVLGRKADSVTKNNELIYLFELKEQISDMDGIQECEVLSAPFNNTILITAHIVLDNEYILEKDSIIKKIYYNIPILDGIKIYERFGINPTSGKCDREKMCSDLKNYFKVKDDTVFSVDFV